MWTWLRVVFSGVMALAVSAAAAGSFEDGNTAYQRADYATAMRFWRPLADQGSVDAQFNLGLMYELGRGVPQNYEQAVVWYRKAADKGNPEAQGNLGVMYGNG